LWKVRDVKISFREGEGGDIRWVGGGEVGFVDIFRGVQFERDTMRDCLLVILFYIIDNFECYGSLRYVEGGMIF